MSKLMTVSPLFHTILHWTNSANEAAHCLCAVYGNSEWTVVLSAIRGGDVSPPLMRDLAGAATAASAFFAGFGIEAESVIWIIHHGPFSDYESLQQEEWAQVQFYEHDRICEVDWASWKTLSQSQISELRQRFELPPVFETLAALGWTG